MTLVIMAAGMGSRFGGLKQLAPLTDDEEFIIDFTVYDAVRAGFDKIIFIIKEENLALFEQTIGARVRKSGVEIGYAFQKQELEGVETPPERKKPWGTTHAILSLGEMQENFGVLNADDFYGFDTLRRLHDFLAEAKDGEKAHYCMIGYSIAHTLSEHGTVSRGVCRVGADGMLDFIEENKKIERLADGRIINTFADGRVAEIAEDATVSMNCFGFTPSVLRYMKPLFAEFLEKNKADLSACELLVPTTVKMLIDAGVCDVRVIPTESVWKGVTYAEDSEPFREFIREEKALGHYPKSLWEK
ncbi:MAG: NTP transferase domain-containing protein [Clostridia bacterium]|nr:NTP transferase domain-containing protein [Clostridia bacterium]